MSEYIPGTRIEVYPQGLSVPMDTYEKVFRNQVKGIVRVASDTPGKLEAGEEWVCVRYKGKEYSGLRNLNGDTYLFCYGSQGN